MMELEWMQTFFVILEKIFPGEAVGKGLQRGFMFAGLVFIFLKTQMLITAPAGTWQFYKRRRRKRIIQSVALADKVARLEGQSDATALRIKLLLSELQVRKGTLPPQVTHEAPVPAMPGGYAPATIEKAPAGEFEG